MEMRVEDRYCPSCGSDNKPWICPHCGQNTRGMGIFTTTCTSCNGKFECKDLSTKDGKKYIGLTVFALVDTPVGAKYLYPYFRVIKKELKQGLEYNRSQRIEELKDLFVSWWTNQNYFIEPLGINWEKLYDRCFELYIDMDDPDDDSDNLFPFPF